MHSISLRQRRAQRLGKRDEQEADAEEDQANERAREQPRHATASAKTADLAKVSELLVQILREVRHDAFFQGLERV